ncbi:MFS transporter, partial [Klebsiella pneumoniae]
GSIAILLAGFCFLFTRIDLTKDEVNATESLKVVNALELLKNKQFWMLMIFMLFVNQIYDTYDQQFAQYFSMQFTTRAEGNHWFGVLGSIQVCFETVFLAIVPFFVNRIGAKKALILAGTIMTARILGSAIELGPIWIASMKMAHAIEKPLIVVSLFKFIAANFDNKLSSTVYLLMLFSASLATTIYSPLAGYLYDSVGFVNAYIIFGSIAGTFTIFSSIMLEDKDKKRVKPYSESTPA